MIKSDHSRPGPVSPSFLGDSNGTTRPISPDDLQALGDRNAPVYQTPVPARPPTTYGGAYSFPTPTQSLLSNPFDEFIDLVPSNSHVEFTTRPLTTEDLHLPLQTSSIQTLLQTVADSSRVIERTMRLANEKDTINNIKLKSLSTAHLVEFIGRAKRDSARAIWHQVPAELRDGLALSFNLSTSLESHFSDDNMFLRCLQQLIERRGDLDPPLILLSGKHMPDTIVKMDRSSMMIMLSSCFKEIRSNPVIFLNGFTDRVKDDSSE